MSDFRCRKSKFDIGDHVRLINGTTGVIDRIGVQEYRNKEKGSSLKWKAFPGILYRVGPRNWWCEWQIARRIAAVKEMP